MDLNINDLVKEKIESLNISVERKKTICLLLQNELDYGDSKEDTKRKVIEAKDSIERGVHIENTSN